MALTARTVTIDCAVPAALAKFWTEALGCEIQADCDGFFRVSGQG